LTVVIMCLASTAVPTIHGSKAVEIKTNMEKTDFIDQDTFENAISFFEDCDCGESNELSSSSEKIKDNLKIDISKIINKVTDFNGGTIDLLELILLYGVFCASMFALLMITVSLHEWSTLFNKDILYAIFEIITVVLIFTGCMAIILFILKNILLPPTITGAVSSV